MTPNATVARNIRRLREEAGLTRPELAERCGWNEGKIRDLEHDRRKTSGVKPDELLELCIALRISVFDLFIPDVDQASVQRTFGPDEGSPVVARGDYIERLFGVPEGELESEPRRNARAAADRRRVRAWILAQHPAVRVTTDPLWHDLDQWSRILQVALEAAGRSAHFRIQIDVGSTDPLDRAKARARLLGLDPNAAYEKLKLADAWRYVVEADRAVREAEDRGVALLEAEIQAGLLTEPPIPEHREQLERLLSSDDELEEVAARWLERVQATNKKGDADGFSP